MFADMPLEAQVYGILFAVAIGVCVLHLIALFRADARADREAALRKAAEHDLQWWSGRAKATQAELAGMRSQYGHGVNQHFEAVRTWTRPGPPADQTVIMTSLAETAILTVVPPDESVLTAAGVSLADPT